MALLNKRWFLGIRSGNAPEGHWRIAGGKAQRRPRTTRRKVFAPRQGRRTRLRSVAPSGLIGLLPTFRGLRLRLHPRLSSARPSGAQNHIPGFNLQKIFRLPALGAAICLCLLVVSTAVFGLPHSPLAGSTVGGRIELTNSKLKPRGGKLDASGVVVWLASADGVALHSASKQRKVITQRNKRFSPHIVAVEAGSEVDFPNEDPFFHNVFSIFNGKRFDLGLYASGETRPVNFNRAGVSYIFCNIHPQMSAVVVALDTPYFAISDPAGGFAIGNVPAGAYRLNVWHERAKPETLAALARTVQISQTGPAQLDLGTIAVSEEGYVPRPHPNKHGQEYDRQQPSYRKP